MSKYKLLPILIGCITIGFLAGIFIYVKFAPTKIVYRTETQNIFSSSTIVGNQSNQNTEKKSDEQVLIYQNREIGFQFKYAFKYVVLENYSPIIETDNFIYPQRGATVLQLQTLSERNDYGETSGYNNMYIYTMKKGDNLKTYKAIINEQAQAQQRRENYCAKSYPDLKSGDFEQCAYYGGGWNYATTTFAGVDAISKVFRGEGDIESHILIPIKGIIISGEHPDILQDFTFIDKDRTITDEATKFNFNCPANWTCNYTGFEKDGYFFGAIGQIQKYYVTGPDEQFFELSIAVTSTQAINKAMEGRESKDSNPYGTKLQKETFSGHTAYKFREFYNGFGQSDISIYTPDIGLFIRMDARFTVSHDLENKFFENAVIAK